MTCRRGVKQEFQKLEKQVWQWVVNEKRERNQLPPRKVIQDYALTVYKNAGHADFKASLGWYRRWEKRYDLKEIRNTSANNKSHISCAREFFKSNRDNLPECKASVPNCIESSAKCNEGLLFENFSIETDKLIGNIDMINSPSEFFNFSDSFDKSMDSTDVCDTIKNLYDGENNCIKNLMTELMDDFGKYFFDNERNCARNVPCGKPTKKSCKYDKDFKDKVISFITENRIKEAAAKFNVHPNTISVWLKEDKFQNHLTQLLTSMVAKSTEDDEATHKEKEFIKWLKENEKNNIMVSKQEVKGKISELFTSSCCASMKSHWFEKYCHRYINGKQSVEGIKIRYSDQFQKLMVNYANNTSQIKAASVFNLARKQLFNWMKNVHSKKVMKKRKADDNLLSWYNSQSSKPSCKMIRSKAKIFHSTESTNVTCSYSWYYKWCAKHEISVKANCDEELVKWILSAYDQNFNVSHQDVQKKALEIYQNDANFKASSGWLLRFCRRYMHLLRCVPNLSVKLPLSCESSVKEFRTDLARLISERNICGESYGVMDEVFLKLKPSGTLNETSQKEPLLRSCGINNIQGTVILSCLSDGRILPPLLILKDKNVRNASSECLVLNQSNGTVDSEVFSFWLENIWFRYVKSPSLLVLDCFSPHNSENVKEFFIKNNSHMAVIPQGCSSKLNPLTQFIAPQFQDKIDENYKRWFDMNNYTWQLGGNSLLLSSEDIIEWVVKAHKSVNMSSSEETVRNIFKEMELSPL